MRDKEEHIFQEDIIYCPSQIYYYFTDNNGEKWCAYIRQRRGPLTFELVNILENDEWKFGDIIPLSRTYDINNQTTIREEEFEIEELEKEVMGILRQRFPEVSFPNSPIRQKRSLDSY